MKSAYDVRYGLNCIQHADATEVHLHITNHPFRHVLLIYLFNEKLFEIRSTEKLCNHYVINLLLCGNVIYVINLLLACSVEVSW